MKNKKKKGKIKMKIEYEEINGLLYPKLALPPQKK